MIAVIQCAAQKKPEAGHLRQPDGKLVLFVAQPDVAPANYSYIYARPDDRAEDRQTWRAKLLEYNSQPNGNPLGLLPAWQLYQNGAYQRLAEHFGRERLYILSAGWGLISAEFLTPVYDITFSTSAERYKKRRKSDQYEDLCMLPEACEEPIVFLGGKDYVPLFSKLSRYVKGPRIVFYNSDKKPEVPGCAVKRFHTTTRTNWHYECCEALVEGGITI